MAKRLDKLPGLVEPASRKTMGRPKTPKQFTVPSVRYSPEIAEEILARLCEGEALRHICRDAHMPSAGAVVQWTYSDAEFAKRYARARETLADHYAAEVVSLADGVAGCTEMAVVQAARLQVDGRKWIASKLFPRVFGDKMTVEGNPDAPLQTLTRIELVAVAPSSPVDLDKLPVIEALPKGDKSS